MDADGARQRGFGGRGLRLSSEALKRASTPHLKNRADAAANQGNNAYFVDSDAFGELYDDFDPDHPMTAGRDRQNRIERMQYLSQDRSFVLGSESAAAWSVPVLHFSHGTETPDTPLLWARLANKRLNGGWWPPRRPAMFFKELDADADFALAEFEPKYRLPLYQAVFHDSIVSTDRWEMALVKYPNLLRSRTVLGLLYGVPSMWNIDQKTLRTHGDRIRALYEFFGPLHRRIGDRPLDSFTWLTPDRAVQRTRFGDVEITANFGETPFQGLDSDCVEARVADGPPNRFCPAPVPK